MGALALLTIALASMLFAAAGLAYARRRLRTVEDYISARGTAGALVTSATLTATALGAWVLSSPPETALSGGVIALVGYGVGSAAPVLAFLWLGRRVRALMPEGHSLTEFVWHRYGRGVYALTVGVMVFYMFIYLTAELTAISLAAWAVSGLPLAATAALVGLATLLYTAHGGLRAVVFTDTLQFLLLLPLLLLVLAAVVAGLGGPGAVLSAVEASSPQLLDPGYRPGVELAVVLVIAILAANLFHQGYWQRVWTARDEGDLLKGFALASAAVIPLVFLTGLFGLLAAASGGAEHPSRALFEVVSRASPWAVWAVLLLAVALAMSSVDSLLNGLVSAFTSDLWRSGKGPPGRLLRWARALTVAVALPAVGIAATGPSVLYLFFIADLVSAAAVFPVFYGLYSRHHSGVAALAGALAGLAVGGLFFPLPDFSRGVLGLQASLLYSFAGALLASALVSLALERIALALGRARPYNLARLRHLVGPIHG